MAPSNIGCVYLEGYLFVVNLNYTASPQSIRAAVRKANLVNVYTSRRFVDKLALRGVDVDAILCDVRVHYLEDIRDEMGGVAKLAALFAARFLPLSLVWLWLWAFCPL